MGTRNSTIVTLDGETKVAQYGQWDGYPTGAGETIQEFLRTADLEEFKKKLRKIHPITHEEVDIVNNTTNWPHVYPHLSRDAGADVLNMINTKDVKFLSLDTEFKNDGLFCEYWYDINLDNETVTMNDHEFTFKEWTKEGFMEELEKAKEDD